jgi:[ribosomal protein S18]-alanine N-acetyltransferase
MLQGEAQAIADWRYDPPYDFYDMRADASDLDELLDAERRQCRYFSACDVDGELIGFFAFGRHGNAVVIGLGLRPDHTGRGIGRSFLEEGLAFARERFEPQSFRLSVAQFNERAITVYERAGFNRTRSYRHETNGGVFPFIEMERQA